MSTTRGIVGLPALRGPLEWCERHETAIIEAAAAALIVFAVFPIWAVHFPPLQDYPLHLLRANIIAHYGDPARRYYDAFTLSLWPIPYILSDYIISGLGLLLPITTAGKIFLTAYVILLPISFFYFIWTATSNKFTLGFFSFLLIHNRHFEKGNTAYFFSFPLFLFALGYWWNHRIQPTLRQKVILSVLILMVYLCHLYTFLFLLFSVGVLALREFRSPSKAPRALLSFLPSILLLGVTLATQSLQKPPVTGVSRNPVVFEYPNLKGKLEAVVNQKLEMPYLMTFSPRRERRILIASLALIVCLLVGSWRNWRTSSFPTLLLALSALYLVLPQHLIPGYDIAPRTLIFILLVAPVCLDPPSSSALRLGVTALLVLLSLYSLRGSCRDYLSVDSRLDDYYSVLKEIPPNERVSFRVHKDDMYVGYVTPYALFGTYYYVESGGLRTDDIGLEMWDVFRSVKYRRSEPPPPLQLDSSLASLNPGVYAIVLLANQQSRVDSIARQEGFRAVLETQSLAIYQKTRNAPVKNWFAGNYYVLGDHLDCNYLLLWQSSSLTNPGIDREFKLVARRGQAQLWRRLPDGIDPLP